MVGTVAASGRLLDARGESLAAGGETLAARQVTLGAHGRLIAALGNTIPAHAGSIAARGETIAAHGGSIAAHGKTVPAHGETVPARVFACKSRVGIGKLLTQRRIPHFLSQARTERKILTHCQAVCASRTRRAIQVLAATSNLRFREAQLQRCNYTAPLDPGK